MTCKCNKDRRRTSPKKAPHSTSSADVVCELKQLFAIVCLCFPHLLRFHHGKRHRASFAGTVCYTPLKQRQPLSQFASNPPLGCLSRILLQLHEAHGLFPSSCTKLPKPYFMRLYDICLFRWVCRRFRTEVPSSSHSSSAFISLI